MAKGGNSPNRHVVPSPKGGWDVKKPGSSRAVAHSETQKTATDRAREIVRNAGGARCGSMGGTVASATPTPSLLATTHTRRATSTSRTWRRVLEQDSPVAQGRP